MTAQTRTNLKTPVSSTIMVAFNQLIEDPENVRKTRSSDGIESLADNILAEGLLQNLIVRKVKGGKYAVTGGERRRRALALLVKRKQMKVTDNVPCCVIDTSATSASLSENIHREAMPPADQFAAWAKMQDDGMSVAEIARHHGASTRLVEQRLKLGRLSPVLLEALRANEIDVEAACAFTITDDQQRQAAVFAALKSHWNSINARAVKAALTENEVADTNKLARLVGREVYQADGGQVRTDLFGETVYFKDAELLTRLATDRLVTEAERLESEGWAWIEIAFDQDWRAGEKMRRIHPKTVALSNDDQIEKDRLDSRLAQLEEAADNSDEAAVTEYDEVEAKLAVLEQKARVYSSKQQATAGGFLSLAHDGSFQVKLGYIRPEDDPKVMAAKRKAAKEKAQQPNTLAHSLRDDLAAIRLEILQIELLSHPIIARDLLVFNLLSKLFSNGYHQTPFELEISNTKGKRASSAKGDMGQFAGRERFEKQVAALPIDWLDIEDMTERFETYRALSEKDKTKLHAYAAVQSLKPQLSDEDNAEQSLECAARMMSTDVAAYWTPGAAFFQRITKGHMLEIARKMVDPAFAQSYQSTKKTALAELMGAVFDPKVKTPGVNQADQNRLAAWIPACMVVVADKADTKTA